MSDIVQDVRVAVRQLWRRPFFTATAVLTLAIGMGVNTVAFSVVNGVLFKGVTTAARPDVGRILTTPGGDESGNASLDEYHRFADATRGALDLAAEGRSSVAWRHDGTTETAYVLFVSPNYFDMVDAALHLGRLHVGRASDSTPAVVVGERFWRDKLSSPPLAGLTLQLNGVEVSVSGIMRESFTGPAGLYSPDVWLPLEDLALFRTSAALQKRDTRWLFLLGALQRDATVAEVQSRVATAAVTMSRDWPHTHRDRGAQFRMLFEGNSEWRGISTAATIAMGIIGLILLLACFNVANLLLARAVERERDMGIRTALGARPSRLVRLVITEGFVLAVVSGMLALVVATWAQSLVSTFAIPIDVPQHIDLAPDGRVVAFIAVLVCIAGVLPGLWPALAAAQVNVSRVLAAQSANAAGGRPSSLGRWLVGAQIAGSTAFLALAALFVQSYSNLSSVDLGFAREHLVLSDVDPASHGHTVDSAERYVTSLVDRVRVLPGIVDVAIADRAPFFIGFARETMVWPAGGACDASCPQYPAYAVGQRYFETMGIALVAGREAGASSNEVVVNQAFARQQWPNGGGLGETLRVGKEGRALTIVGVTAKTHTRGLDREQPSLFLPLTREAYEGSVTIVARTDGAPSALVRAIHAAAGTVDERVPVSVKTMEQRAAVQLWPFRTLSVMFTICGVLALVLAVVGLAGVVIHAVSRRTREFGVRVSVGATPSDLVSDVLYGGVRLLIPGLVAGLLVAAGAAQLTHAMFVGVNVMNPLTYLAVALAQVAIVTIACVAPALRASRVDPLAALRAD